MKKLKWGILITLAAVLGGWWLTFGTLSPCESLRGEIQRAASKKGGILGGVLAEKLAPAATDAYTPSQCAGLAIRFKYDSDGAMRAIANDALPEALRE